MVVLQLLLLSRSACEMVFWPRRSDVTLAEASGALGDLGTFIPIVVALAQMYRLDVGATLVAAGLANIGTGLAFGVPICVQPMKTIAAVALEAEAGEFDLENVLAAGILTAGAVSVLAAVGLIDWVNSVVPEPVVRGMQLGLGALLFRKAAGLVEPLGWAWDGWPLAAPCFALVLLCYESRRVPSALLLFALGLAFATARLHSSEGAAAAAAAGGAEVEQFRGWQTISAAQWWRGGLLMALPQLPLTTLNSVVAVCKLSGDLFPERPVHSDPFQADDSSTLSNSLRFTLKKFRCRRSAWR